MAESELQSGVVSVITGKVDSKTEASLARTYFLQYTQLLRHQKMMQEYLRTGSYHAAMMENFVDFVGKVVVDVGVGSGILSLFAAQAGAKHVYVVEASEMAEYACKLIAGNPSLSDRITVVKGKVEEVELPEKADILVSEPMGTLLVHEMMLKSYVLARDRFLVPSGKMFPKLGRMHMAPFSDETLFDEIANQALFWRQKNYFGVDLTPLYEPVYQSYFSQPVLDTFDPKILVAPAICHVLDLTSIKEEQLYDIEIPLKFTAKVDTKVHGLACWFDLLFDESSVPKLLITTTSYPTIYWFQLRCFLAKPLYVMAGQEITGHLHMIAHDNKSYTLYLELSAEMCGAGAEPRGIRQTSYGRIELKDLCYRTSQPYVQTQSNAAAQDQLPQQLIEEMNQLIIEEPTLRQEDLESSDAIVIKLSDDSTLTDCV